MDELCTDPPYEGDSKAKLELPVRYDTRSGKEFLYCVAYDPVDETCWNCSSAHAQARKELKKCIHAKKD